MAEGAPKRKKSAGSGAETGLVSDPLEAQKQLLRQKISELEQEAGHPVPGALKKEGLEEKILTLEEELRGVERQAANKESVKRIAEIRDRLKVLEQEAGHPTPGALKKEGLEEEILKLEDELRGLERKVKGLPEEEPVVEPAVEENVVTESEGEPDPSKEYLDYYDNRDKKEPEKVPVEEDVADVEKVGAEPTGEKEWDPFVDPKGEKLPEDYEAYFAGRSQDFEKDPEKLVKEEEWSWIRALGEKYNKVPMKAKVAIGATLFAGAFLPFSPAIMAVSIGTMAAQRVLGGLGMFVHFEDRIMAGQKPEEEGGMTKRERQAMAALGSLGYSMATGYALRQGIHWAGEAFNSDTVQHWLAGMWPHDAAPAIDPHSVMSGHPPIESPIEVMSAAPISEPEIPTVVAEASPGHGYEYMMKRLWEQLQDKHLDPSQYSADSDLHKILTADASSIDKVVHQIATQHDFYNPDGTSVLIQPDAHMSFGSGGEIHLGDHLNSDMVQAPEGADVTQPYNPEAHVAPQPETGVENPGTHTEILYEPEGADNVAGPMNPEYAAAHPEIVPPEHVSWEEFEALKQQQNASHSAIAPESYSGAQNTAESIINSHNVEVITSEPHIYADAGSKHLLVYGGSSADQARLVGEFFQNPDNANAVVYTADQTNTYRIPWTNTGGEVTPGAPVRTNGFLGFFKSFMKAPDPSEFRAIIK